MGKTLKKQIMSHPSPTGLPKAPVVYLNDPAADMPHASSLRDMIPCSQVVFLSKIDMPADCPVQGRNMVASDIRNGTYDRNVAIVNENFADSQIKEKIDTAHLLREESIKHGCNFVTVNLYLAHGTPTEDKSKWGTNHLDFCIGGMSAQQVAERVYRWLFKVFSVHESLHLIPESEMLAIDAQAFPDYRYCPISESKSHPKDAKLQFVTLVLSKAVVGPEQKLTWTVADKTGVATFYFQYRGPSSQYTWDWVLALQPGERRALPRMPMVEIKERKTVRVIKAPFRTVGFVVEGVGLAVRSVGQGVVKLGELGRLGKSSEWVAKEDVVNGKKVDWPAVFAKEGRAKDAKIEQGCKCTTPKVFNEKGEKVWKDDDSTASTTGGDDAVDEKVIKEFC
ncbi:hypothetical protein A1O3_10378 [Capronia epimyces CBS 606.96]|uniref:Uncharacterized protein n=1 Tax=Capronia epimyces CBS 606.96 TaxID=1182542 RepID=W9XIN6_9EURO|nr:uncharacterized protein A1O3_10378 [Capronia epimyces CBS 606.96]EXJ77220.1 hypothetical protein A1O3_10378 [Capronia epimyces CBS 606.96]